MNRFKDFVTAKKILRSYRSFAIVGCSSNPARPSYGVARYLLTQRYGVVPVNPHEDLILGKVCYPDLLSIPKEIPIEVVDIFRRSSDAGRHVDEAIELGAKAVWMQLGVIDEEAAERAAAAGLDVVMDRCPAIDHPRLVTEAGANP